MAYFIDLWVANCCFAHISLGFRLLLDNLQHAKERKTAWCSARKSELVGASRFEPPSSWSRTMNTNSINALSGVAYGTKSLVSPFLIVRMLSVKSKTLIGAGILMRSPRVVGKAIGFGGLILPDRFAATDFTLYFAETARGSKSQDV
jgi:hypothetical protein